MPNTSARLNPLAFGLSLGVIWGFSLLFIGLMAFCCGWGVELVNIIGDFYIGYDATVLGSFIGLVWGFLDCFIGGVIIACLYNLITSKLEGS